MMTPAARTANNTAAVNHIPLVSTVFSSLSLVGGFGLSLGLLLLLSIEPSISGNALMDRPLYRRFDCGDMVHDLLYLFEGPGLDLAHALARHTEFVGQLSKRHRVFGQAPALKNASRTRLERAKRNGERAATVIEFLARREHRLLVRGVTNQPVLPFGRIAC